jgi:HIRAN domain
MLHSMALGTELRLVREPDNKHDHLAVQVRTNGINDQMLGYVPRSANVDVAWALDGKVRVKAVFAGLQEQGQPVMQIVWE